MTEWIFNLKTKLTVLVMMLCSLCVTKVYAVELGINECAVTSGQNINLRSINLTTDDFKPARIRLSIQSIRMQFLNVTWDMTRNFHSWYLIRATSVNLPRH